MFDLEVKFGLCKQSTHDSRPALHSQAYKKSNPKAVYSTVTTTIQVLRALGQLLNLDEPSMHLVLTSETSLSHCYTCVRDMETQPAKYSNAVMLYRAATEAHLLLSNPS